MTRMSTVLLFGFLFFRLFSQVEAEAPSRDFLLTPSSAGRIRLGASKQEVLQLYRDHRVKEVDLFLEGSPGSPALLIYKGKEFLLTAELLKGTVYRISTTNPKFATRDGIRVGSTIGEAKRHYGEPSSMGGGEGGFYVAFDFESGTRSLSFRVHVEPYLLEEHLTDQSKILEILVVQLP